MLIGLSQLSRQIGVCGAPYRELCVKTTNADLPGKAGSAASVGPSGQARITAMTQKAARHTAVRMEQTPEAAADSSGLRPRVGAM